MKKFSTVFIGPFPKATWIQSTPTLFTRFKRELILKFWPVCTSVSIWRPSLLLVPVSYTIYTRTYVCCAFITWNHLHISASCIEITIQKFSLFNKKPQGRMLQDVQQRGKNRQPISWMDSEWDAAANSGREEFLLEAAALSKRDGKLKIEGSWRWWKNDQNSRRRRLVQGEQLISAGSAAFRQTRMVKLFSLARYTTHLSRLTIRPMRHAILKYPSPIK
jgi:hypothetical protein